MSFLRQKVCRLEADQYAHFPHRPVKTGSANVKERVNTALQVPSLFHDQEQWLQKIRQIKFDSFPDQTTVPAQVEMLTELPVFLVVHLFSGRRRATDLHACLGNMARAKGFRVQILSLDTAVSQPFTATYIRSMAHGNMS